MTNSSHRLEAAILPTQPASGAFPGGEASVLRNFDLNDRPGADEVGLGPTPRSQKTETTSDVPFFAPLADITNNLSWICPTSFPAVST